MGYKVRVAYDKGLKRDYGTEKEGEVGHTRLGKAGMSG